jgi:hypothetical protein
MYVRGLQEGESHMYASCNGNSHVYMGCIGENHICMWVAVRRIMYIVFWAGAGMYMLTGDAIRSYRWSTTNLWAKEIFS